MLTISVVGERVICKQSHWKRAGEFGSILEIKNEPGRGLHYFIQFDDKYDGGGIDGDKLWLYENDFDPLTKAEFESLWKHKKTPMRSTKN